MQSRIVVLTFAAALAAAPALAERPEGAVPRGGSDSGSRGDHGGSRGGDSGARHPSSGSSTYSGGSSSSGGSGNSTVLSGSQRRHPRPGSGTGRPTFTYLDYDRHYWYSPYHYGSRYYFDWWYGPGWYRWSYHPYHSYRYVEYDDHGSLRLQIKPSRARVYVDGYYAGVVDDFDGLFQRLHLPPGRHELSFKLDGYRTHRMRVYVPADQTLKIRYELLPGSGDDTLDDTLDRPAADRAERELERERERRRERATRERDAERERWERRPTRDERERADDDAEDTEDAEDASAELGLSVLPEKAAVYVDGSFRGTGADLDELLLAPGRHRVEVVAPGYKTFDREIDVKAGENPELTVELQRP